MPFACIFVPDFPVEAVLRAEPELRSQAVAVLAGKPPLQKVFSGNEEARRAGVEPGMTKLQVEACAGMVLRPRSALQETAAHAALLDCAQSFSPRVEDAGSDTILLDLAGLQPLFGSLAKIALDIARRSSELGLEANVAVSSNSDTSVIAARGFCGVTVIPEGREAEQMGTLPVEVLFRKSDSDPEAEQFLDTLSRWGIRNLRALAALPTVALSERLGQKGIQLQQLTRGATFRTLVPVDAPLIFEEAVELEHPLMLLEPLAFLLGRLLDQLCARLNARALATQELRLRLELDHSCQSDFSNEESRREDHNEAEQPERNFPRSFIRTLRLPVPLLDPRTFLKLLQLDLKAHPPGAPILKIHLSVEPSRPRAAQGGLFLPPSPEPEKLELTIAKIAGIVGEDKVGSLRLLDSYRSERFCMQRFVTSDSKKKSDSFPKHSYEESRSESPNKLVTALRIFRPAMQATVMLRDGKPVHVLSRKGIKGEVLWAAGPWRSSGDWWEQEGWARDEWDIAVQQESGITLYRLVRDLFSALWFLEGSYD
ncbi:MAG: hypothetical protein NVS9B5_14940 [Terriglobales bacterium]